MDATLAETGLDYIDLYLIHAPYGGREGRLGAWKALVEAVDAGKVRSIGVSNYGVHHLEELETWIKEQDEKEGRGKGGVLSVNQVELHPWCAREDIVQWCRQRGILLEVSEESTVVFSGKCYSHSSQGVLSAGAGNKKQRSTAVTLGKETWEDHGTNLAPMEPAEGMCIIQLWRHKR